MKVLLTFGVLVLLIGGFYLVSYAITKYTGYSITGKIVYSKDEKIEIGKCLSEKDIALYCTSLSLNCLRQRETLDETFNYLKYVDCSENVEQCKELNLPAWKIKDRFYFGIYDIDKLVEFSGCEVRK